MLTLSAVTLKILSAFLLVWMIVKLIVLIDTLLVLTVSVDIVRVFIASVDTKLVLAFLCIINNN